MGIAPPGLVSHLRHQKACAPQASVLRSTLRSCAVQKYNPSTEQPQPLPHRSIHLEPVSATKADAKTTQYRLLPLALPRLSPAQRNRISRAELATICKEINTFVVSRTHCRWQQAWFAARAEHCGASQIATSAGPGGSGLPQLESWVWRPSPVPSPTAPQWRGSCTHTSTLNSRHTDTDLEFPPRR